MITFMEAREDLEENEKHLDPQLWHACAGGLVQMPMVNSTVYYFPQGHAEHASSNVDLRECPRVAAHIPCRVFSVKFKADPGTDEVYSKIGLVPFIGEDVDFCNGGVAASANGLDNQEKPASFAKTLTQSDANNGGGFSVPRYCAETIFPRLDYTADPPVQTLIAKDVHGEMWKFRHIYRGTPRRHLLTTGWSTFVNHKKLVAGDSIVFMRLANGDICVGIRRAKKGIGGGSGWPIGWNTSSGGNSIEPYVGFSAFLKDDEGNWTRHGNGYRRKSQINRGRVKPEDVIKAITLASNGQPFDVEFYPRASTPEFCVKAHLVKEALQIRWSSGMRFKMAFETEDSSRISWFMGTISSAQAADPFRWPDSPWRLLMVSWDEPDLLHNVKRVNPWQVELVSNMPPIHVAPFPLPRKKLRFSQQSEFPLDSSQIPLPALSGNPLFGSSNPLGYLPNYTPAGMQGARHAQYGLALSDLHLNKMQSGSIPPLGFLHHQNHAYAPSRTSIPVIPEPGLKENVSCLLTMGNSTKGSKKSDHQKAPTFVLFGQPILTEKQISLSCLSDTPSPAGTDSDADKMGKNTSEGSGSSSALCLKRALEHGGSESDTGHCKVFMESEDVGRTLDLSLLSSYEELYSKLANMFGIEMSEVVNRVVYQDAMGAVKRLCDERFSNLAKMTRRLMITADHLSCSNNIAL